VSGGLRLAVCTTHPIQCEAPILRLLAATPNLTLHAFFGTDMSVRGYLDEEFGIHVKWDTPLVSGYRHTFLSTDPGIQRIGFWQPAATGLLRAFRAFQPDAVLLTSYAGRFDLEALRAAKKVGAKVVMRHVASDVAVTRSRLKSRVRDLVLRRLYQQIDGFAVIGQEAQKHLRRLGVPESKMASAPHCVDTDFFSGEVARWSPQRAKLRAELGIGPQDVALVFSGKLIPKKDPLLITAALQMLQPAVLARIHLLIAGDGELRGEMERAVRNVLGERGRFFGFLNQSEIGRAYAAGDLLVLPSRAGAGETWGLVVNEAMQFGLGAVVSDGVGCAPDLVTNSTGVVFRSGSVAAAATALQAGVTSIQTTPGQFAVAARRRIADFTAARSADGVAWLARSVCRRPAP
jgi:glycosyltransferase involved in cell wall biosynthesis